MEQNLLKPQRVRRLARVPGDGSSSMAAGQSLVIQDVRGVVFITPDAEEAIGEDGTGMLAKTMFYTWAVASQ
jgi:hypothetical protein